MLNQVVSSIQNPVTGTFGSGNIQFFSTPGTVTWQIPANVNAVRARMWGGGSYVGGGGFAIKTIYDLGGANNVVVTVGSSGYGSISYSGGTSSFGSYVSATGGSPSNIPTSSMYGGTGVGGDINTSGGVASSNNFNSSGGGGCGSIFGNGGNGAQYSPLASTGGAGGAAYSSGASYSAGGSGYMSTGAIGYYNSTGGVTMIPASAGLYATIPSIDYIGTGGGGCYFQNMYLSGMNGGGGSTNGPAGWPGGGAGGYPASGLVIVEW